VYLVGNNIWIRYSVEWQIEKFDASLKFLQSSLHIRGTKISAVAGSPAAKSKLHHSEITAMLANFASVVSSNASPATKPTDGGTETDSSEQPRKQPSQIRNSSDRSANKTDCNFELLKYDSQRFSTELGMQIDCNEQNSKHDSSVRFGHDPDSNPTDSIVD
jgi:hypothetical protein